MGNVVNSPLLRWQSSDHTVAVVTNQGVVTAIDNGSATVIVTWETVSDSAVINVRAAPVGLELGAVGFDLALDTIRRLAYVSLPMLNEVVVISTTSNTIVRRVLVGFQPHGIDVSLDNSKLYVALNGSGAIAVVDLDSNAVSEIEIGDSLGSPLAWDVVEARPNRLFASANPNAQGLAWIVQVATDLGNAYWRVASDRWIRAAPELERTLDGTSLYVGEGFSPNSLYRLDMTDSLVAFSRVGMSSMMVEP